MSGNCQDCDKEPSGPTSIEQSKPGDTPQSQTTAQINPSGDDLLDPTSFVPPSPSASLPRLVIEFCDRCRWLHRATWVQTELFLTFPTTLENGTGGIKAIALVPRTSAETGGRFRVWLYRDSEKLGGQGGSSGSSHGDAELVWDRKIEGGFPELKILKQRIRNLISPQQNLGHSDKHAVFQREAVPTPASSSETTEISKEQPQPVNEVTAVAVDDYTPRFRC